MSPSPLAGLEREPITITPLEFQWFTTFLRSCTGIELKPGKEALVMGRLDRRLDHYGLSSYAEYFRMLGQKGSTEETRVAIDLMTTNETYFFREPQHFELLPELLPPPRGDVPVRVWSAASSTGEEAYSVALTLADCAAGRPWEVLGTDVSTRVLETARRGLFPIEAASGIPRDLLVKHCLKGSREFAGQFTLSKELRARVTFSRANLVRPLPEIGRFDVVFLRNVMIYFANETKEAVVRRIAEVIRPGGYLLIGHAETLSGLDTGLEAVRPSVYRAGGAGR